MAPPFAGTFSQTIAVGGALVEIKGSVTWRLSDLASLPYDGGAIYIVANGSAEATYQGQVTPGDGCDGRIVGDGKLQLGPAHGSVTLFPGDRYSGSLDFTVQIASVMCGVKLVVPWPVNIPLAGVLRRGDMWENPRADSIGDMVTQNRWNFTGH